MKRSFAIVLLALLAFSTRARAWEPFRSQNGDVDRGNELLEKGRAKEALEAYDSAARKLPNEPGVQLNRGLALLKEGKLGPAREAFRSASQGSAPAAIRGEALYDMGLAFLQEAEIAAKGEQLEAAQKALREAVDAFKGSLRAKPGNRDAAWNLELAKRRLVEVDKKKKEQDEKKEEEKKDEEKKDEEKNDQDAGTPPDQQPDAGAGEQKPPEQDQQGDQQKPEDQGKDEAKEQPDKQGDDQSKDQPGKEGQAPEPKDDAKQEQPTQGKQEPEPAQGSPEERMPEHMRKALDALESSEQNLEKHRAQTRARQRPRRIQKDW